MSLDDFRYMLRIGMSNLSLTFTLCIGPPLLIFVFVVFCGVRNTEGMAKSPFV